MNTYEARYQARRDAMNALEKTYNATHPPRRLSALEKMFSGVLFTAVGDSDVVWTQIPTPAKGPLAQSFLYRNVTTGEITDSTPSEEF